MLQDAAGQTTGIIFEDFAARYYAIIAQLFERRLEPVPGMRPVLAKLDLPKCVASNAPLDKTRHSLAITGLDVYFEDHVFSAYEIERWKPEPDLFLYAASQMGYPPEACAVIEDSPVGVQAALAAGMRTFHFTNGGIEPVVENVVQIRSMAELLKYVGSGIRG
jgi:HAD superfamily hydrolase (TIGR01509 family)